MLYVGIYIGINKIICINYFVRLILFSLSKIWIDKVMLKINRDVLVLFFGMYLRINKICMMIWIIESFFNLWVELLIGLNLWRKLFVYYLN